MRHYMFKGEVHSPEGPVPFRGQHLSELISFIFRSMKDTDICDLTRKVNFLAAMTLEALLDPPALPRLFPEILQHNAIVKMEIIALADSGDAVFYRRYAPNVSMQMREVEHLKSGEAKEAWDKSEPCPCFTEEEKKATGIPREDGMAGVGKRVNAPPAMMAAAIGGVAGISQDQVAKTILQQHPNFVDELVEARDGTT